MRYAGALAVAFFSAAIGLAHFAQPAIAAGVPVAPALVVGDTGLSYSGVLLHDFSPAQAGPTE